MNFDTNRQVYPSFDENAVLQFVFYTCIRTTRKYGARITHSSYCWMGAEKSTLEDRIFELRFSAKQLARDSEKAEKESQKAKKDVA